MNNSGQADDDTPEDPDGALIVPIGVASLCTRLGAQVRHLEQRFVWDHSVIELFALGSGVDDLGILNRQVGGDGGRGQPWETIVHAQATQEGSARLDVAFGAKIPCA